MGTVWGGCLRRGEGVWEGLLGIDFPDGSPQFLKRIQVGERQKQNEIAIA